MATDYCDRSTELLICAQLLYQKVVEGRVVLKPRKSRPGVIDSYFAPTLLKTHLIPLVHQASNSLTLCQAKMDQLVSLSERLISAPTADKVLAGSISNLAQNLQPEIVATSSLLQRTALVSAEVQREFSGHSQVCKHVKALVSAQEGRLAELSRRLRDFMEANRAIVSDQHQDISVATAPLINPPPTMTSLLVNPQVPSPPLSNHKPQTKGIPFETGLRVRFALVGEYRL